MLDLIREGRQVKVSCPSLDGSRFELLFRSMAAEEELSGLFVYDVELLSRSPNVPMDKVLGFEMTLTLELGLPAQDPPALRHFNGYVASFNFVGIEGELAVYRAVLRPKMWLLTRSEDCRIWEDQAVPDVVEAIFKDYGINCDTKTFLTHDRGDDYKRREYCVQYNETDFDFVSRLLEEEGIHYFFVHKDGEHEVVLADSIMGHVPLDGYGSVPFHLQDRRTDRDVEAVTSWSVHQSVEADHVALGDYDFVDPRHEHIAARATSQSERKHPRAGHFERYHYPDSVVKMREYGGQMAESLAKVRAQELHAQCEVILGVCTARGIAVGGTFGISGHPREELNKPAYLVTKAMFDLHSGDYQSSADPSQRLTYSCRFAAINTETAFRPARKTPKPLMHGPQTAIVVDSGGAPIHTDKYGRVRVSFPWIRPNSQGKKEVSCWTRVSQGWAGANWGSMHVPHVGHEVIVSFLDGDPDRPIVTGRVYNGQNTPWQKLPDHATRSYIRDQVGNRIVMQSKEEEKGISIHTPSLDTHLWLGKIDGLELPDIREDAKSRVVKTVGEKLGGGPDPLAELGGFVADTVGDIVTHSEGSHYDVAERDRVEFVGGNSFEVNEQDHFLVVKGKAQSFMGSRAEEVKGPSSVVNLSGSTAINVAAKAEINLAMSASLSVGASLSVSRCFKVEYAKDKKHDLTKNNVMTAQKEHKIQVSAIPALQESSSKTFLGMKSGFPPNAFAGLLHKKQKEPTADAEVILNPDKVLIRCADTIIHLTKDGNVIIKAPKGKVHLKSKEMKQELDDKFSVKTKTVDLKAKTVNVGANLTAKS